MRRGNYAARESHRPEAVLFLGIYHLILYSDMGKGSYLPNRAIRHFTVTILRQRQVSFFLVSYPGLWWRLYLRPLV